MRSPAGKFNKRFAVLKKTDSQDSLGHAVPVYGPTPVGYVWGSLTPTTASQQYSAEIVGHVLTHTIHTRYADIVTPYCRLVWRNRTFHVNGVRNLHEADEELELSCSEVTT